MIENFTKSLGFLGIDASNLKHEPCDKNMFKFEDETINKYWRTFYAFYKTGYMDACNRIGVLAVQEIGKNG